MKYRALCKGVDKQGYPCGNYPSIGGAYCRFHQSQDKSKTPKSAKAEKAMNKSVDSFHSWLSQR